MVVGVGKAVACVCDVRSDERDVAGLDSGGACLWDAPMSEQTYNLIYAAFAPHVKLCLTSTVDSTLRQQREERTMAQGNQIGGVHSTKAQRP